MKFVLTKQEGKKAKILCPLGDLSPKEPRIPAPRLRNSNMGAGHGDGHL